MVLVWVPMVWQMVEWVWVPSLQPLSSMSSELVPSKASRSSHEHRTDMSLLLMPLEMLVGRQLLLERVPDGRFLEILSEPMTSSVQQMEQMSSLKQIIQKDLDSQRVGIFSDLVILRFEL